MFLHMYPSLCTGNSIHYQSSIYLAQNIEGRLDAHRCMSKEVNAAIEQWKKIEQ